MLDHEDDTDEEITVIENVSDAVEDIPIEDLKPKDLRTLIMSYIELVQKFSSDKISGCSDLK